MSGPGAGDDPGVLRVPGRPGGPAPRGFVIPMSELSWRFSGAGGPGGQHVNTANTRAEVRFDVEASPSLDEATRSLLLERVGPTVAVTAADRRSQAMNRRLALERLARRLSAALDVERPRRPTRPTRASVRRRLDAKRRRSETKQGRRGWAGE